MAQPDFDLILERCILRLRQGETVADCLATYPAQADALGPLLELSADLSGLPRLEPAQEVQAAHLNAMLGAFERQFTEEEAGLAWWQGLFSWLPLRRPRQRPFLPTRQALAIGLVAITLITGLLFSASAQALPGDNLYTLKRASEQLRLTLVQSPPAEARLLERFNQERMGEIERLQQLGRSAEVEFSGVIVAQEAGLWQLAGLRFAVTAETQGERDVVVGETAVVRARLDADGQLTALQIDRPPRADVGSPEPTATAQPTTPTRLPSPPTLDATATEPPSATPAATREPSATPTPLRDASPTAIPSPTPERDIAPTATNTPLPPNDRQPSPTPQPIETEPARPSPTPVSDREPEPTPLPTQAATEPPPTPTAARDAPPPPTATPVRDGDGDRRQPP